MRLAYPAKPATPGPPIAEAGAARITRPASFRSTQLFRGIQLCAAPHFDNRISPEATESPISVNRPPFGDRRFTGNSGDSSLIRPDPLERGHGGGGPPGLTLTAFSSFPRRPREQCRQLSLDNPRSNQVKNG